MKKYSVIIGLLLVLGSAHAETNAPPRASITNGPTMTMVQLDGEKWYTPQELAEIVRNDAKRKKVTFDFEHSQCGMDVRTSGSNDVVRVVYSKGLGQPAYTAFLNRKGLVTTNFISTPLCGYGDKK